jgi:hypothetical protein
LDPRRSDSLSAPRWCQPFRATYRRRANDAALNLLKPPPKWRLRSNTKMSKAHELYAIWQ